MKKSLLKKHISLFITNYFLIYLITTSFVFLNIYLNVDYISNVEIVEVLNYGLQITLPFIIVFYLINIFYKGVIGSKKQIIFSVFLALITFSYLGKYFPNRSNSEISELLFLIDVGIAFSIFLIIYICLLKGLKFLSNKYGHKKLILLIVGIISTIVILEINNPKEYKSPMEEILEEAGVAINEPPKNYGDKFAKEIFDLLLNEEEIKLVSGPDPHPRKAQAILFGYEEGNKLLSLQKSFDVSPSKHININIGKPEGIKNRHRTEIGIDMQNWELIKEESDNQEKPFKRIHLLVQRRGENGRMAGLVFFEGAMVTLEYQGWIDDKVIQNIQKATWGISNKIDDIYRDYFKDIVESPLFHQIES